VIAKALIFLGLWVALRFVLGAAYGLTAVWVMRRYILWRLRAPARRRGRARIRGLAKEYEATGRMDPELKEVFDEIGEMG
jgi:hypothetical protein